MSYKKSPFENAPKKHVNKTRFNMSHEHKMQMAPGGIFPCMRPLEVMPGDEVDIQSQVFMRWEALYFPIMHKITMRADTYYVPYRILWPKGEGDNVGWMDWLTKMEDVQHPYTSARMAQNTVTFEDKVLAYMGLPLLPPDPTPGYQTRIEGLNAFPLSAYLMIWDWYERNPQLEDEIWFPLTNGDNTLAFETAFGGVAGSSFPILSAKWEKDMFTSALPQPQIADPIKIPQVIPFNEMLLPSYVDNPVFRDQATGLPVADGDLMTVGGIPVSGANQVYYDPMDAAANIKMLREAEVLQSFHERVMKIGDRYDDYILGLYGTKPQPGIINIPVLIGSIFGKVQIGDVMAQAEFTATVSATRKVGDYAGVANLYEEGHKMSYTCNEHGIILMLIQVNANTSYGQGIERMWRRSVQTDYPLDMFATIGDQEILKEEILYTGLSADNARSQETFGYIDRFAESKFKNDVYVGTLGLDIGLSQHLGRWWDPLTTIGATYSDTIEINGGRYEGFINANPNFAGGHRLVDVFRLLPVDNLTVPVPTQGTIWSWMFHSIWINRALPLFSTPSL